MNAKIVEFDIDGTLTEDVSINPQDKAGTYIYRKPNWGVIELVRTAYSAGWTVTIHTGRREEQRRITEAWLAQHQVPYHFLLMGKPPCTFRIDDVNCDVNDFAKIMRIEQQNLWDK